MPFANLYIHEMWYIMAVQFFGLALFSTIAEEVFDYKTEVTVEKEIKK